VEALQQGRAVAVSPTAFLALAGSAETMLKVSVGCTRTGWPRRKSRPTTATPSSLVGDARGSDHQHAAIGAAATQEDAKTNESHSGSSSTANAKQWRVTAARSSSSSKNAKQWKVTAAVLKKGAVSPLGQKTVLEAETVAQCDNALSRLSECDKSILHDTLFEMPRSAPASAAAIVDSFLVKRQQYVDEQLLHQFKNNYDLLTMKSTLLDLIDKCGTHALKQSLALHRASQM
jgi:hypothetical protein